MPRNITIRFSSQKNRKQAGAPQLVFFQPGASATIIAWIASPPIHVWIPNHPHATSARSIAGTFAPSTPNAERANTGKGIPYSAPACAFSSIGTSTSTLPRNTVKIACFQLMPPAIIELASR